MNLILYKFFCSSFFKKKFLNIYLFLRERGTEAETETETECEQGRETQTLSFLLMFPYEPVNNSHLIRSVQKLQLMRKAIPVIIFLF